jgi:hypothetical protein
MKTLIKVWWQGLGLGCLVWMGTGGLLAAEGVTATAVEPVSGVTTNVPSLESVETPEVVSVNKDRKSRSKDDSIKEYLGMGMGFFALAAGFGLAFLAIWSDYRKRRDLIDMLHRERMLALEKGLELPEIPRTLVGEQPESKPGYVSPTKGLKGGLIWLVTGLGFTLFFAFEVGRTGDGRWNGPNPALGLIPAGIGVVNLICYWVERRARGGSLEFGDSSLK